MIETRSDAVICVFRNFSAAFCARTWSTGGIEEKSKNITIRRLS